MSEYTSCPNCKTELKSGILSGIKLLSEVEIRLINEYNKTKAEGYCSKCGYELLRTHKKSLTTEKTNLTNYLKSKIGNVPVITIHSPLNWNYKVLGMVTGQSTTGTGVITEFTSSITDFLGDQSGRHNKKLKAGENMCFSQLRLQTLNLGGNAVIATDIDYSEVGGHRGMLMVCMSGTAVRLENVDILEKELARIILKLSYANKRLKLLRKYG